MKKVSLVGVCVAAFLSMGLVFTSYSYKVTSGITARTDPDRWVDNWRNLKEAGIDCTGTIDATTLLQAAIDAAPDHSTLIAPVGCQIKISSTITFSGRVDINLMTLQHPLSLDTGANNPPKIIWAGAGAGPWINIIDSTAINIQGFYFSATAVNTFNSVIVMDGDGTVGHHTPTLNSVQYNSFDMGNQSNSSLTVISLEPTSAVNNENYNISNNDMRCGSTSASRRAVDGVINNTSTTLTSATATFVVGDVGKRVRVSYATGILDTTIASRTNATTVVLTAAAASSQTGATVHIGEALGTAIKQNGANAFHTRFHENRIDSCAVAYDMVQGNFDITHYGAGGNDVGIQMTNSTGVVNFFDAEHDLRAFSGVGSVYITWMRAVTDRALANGWIYDTGTGTRNIVITGLTIEQTPPANSVFMALGGTINFISNANNFGTATFAQANLCTTSQTDYTNNAFSGFTGISGHCGSNNLPTSSAGLPAGAFWRNSNVLTVVP